MSTQEYVETRWERKELSTEELVIDYEEEKEAAEHWLYDVIPRHRSQLYWYDFPRWCSQALFGNDDDGLFGEGDALKEEPEEGYCPGRAITWGARNPLHNFCFYVIGQADQCNDQLALIEITDDSVEMIDYQEQADTVFPDEQWGFFMALHGWKPFISLRLSIFPNSRSDFYIGWRERGNSGIKFLPLDAKE